MNSFSGDALVLGNTSLSIVLGVLFLASMGGQMWAGWLDSNADALLHGDEPGDFASYLTSGHFWEATGAN